MVRWLKLSLYVHRRAVKAFMPLAYAAVQSAAVRTSTVHVDGLSCQKKKKKNRKEFDSLW